MRSDLANSIIATAIVMNEMRRLNEVARPKTLRSITQAPTLQIEPKADCSRYDNLRRMRMIIDRHAQLKALHLHGMAAAWQEWQVEGNTRHKPVMPEI